VLGIKAALGLHRSKEIPRRGSFPTALKFPDHQELATEAAERSVTLVKDTQDLLPLNPQKHKRILVITEGVSHVMAPEPVPFDLVEQLAQAGFEVKLLGQYAEVEPREFDLVLYLFGKESMMTRSHIYIDWMRLHNDLEKGVVRSPGKNLMRCMQRYWHDVPTMMISFGHPYYLYDAPRVPTYINAYSSTIASQSAVLKLLLGQIPLSTGNPVDPFCGLEDARY